MGCSLAVSREAARDAAGVPETERGGSRRPARSVGDPKIDRRRLAAILLDVAALSLRLNKPLTARLVPIPGKKAGDLIEFDFPYFANSRVMGVRAGRLGGVFVGNETLPLKAR